MKSQLSITIVAYHNYEQIKTAITSIEKYTTLRIDKKIYISDNSTLDGEMRIKEKSDFLKFLSKYGDVEYIDNKANLGFGKGHNVVLNRIESNFHAIVNQDIEIKEDVFSKIFLYMREENTVGMVITKIVDKTGQIQTAYREYPTIFDMFVRMFCKSYFKEIQKNIHYKIEIIVSHLMSLLHNGAFW